MTPSGRRPEPRPQTDLAIDRQRASAILGILGIERIRGLQHAMVNVTKARRRALIQQLRQWRDFDDRMSIRGHFALDEQVQDTPCCGENRR